MVLFRGLMQPTSGTLFEIVAFLLQIYLSKKQQNLTLVLTQGYRKHQPKAAQTHEKTERFSSKSCFSGKPGKLELLKRVP